MPAHDPRIDHLIFRSTNPCEARHLNRKPDLFNRNNPDISTGTIRTFSTDINHTHEAFVQVQAAPFPDPNRSKLSARNTLKDQAQGGLVVIGIAAVRPAKPDDRPRIAVGRHDGPQIILG